MRSTVWPFVGAIRCLVRHGGSGCALPSLPGLSSRMARKTGTRRAKAARARALRAAQHESAAATPPAPLDGESPSPEVLPAPSPGASSGDPSSSAAGSPTPDTSPAPPPGAASGSADDGDGGKATSGGNAHHVRGSPVACGTCGESGKRFKFESIWVCDKEDRRVGKWLHTCPGCIMTREDLPSIAAARVWIWQNASDVASVPPECMQNRAPGFGGRHVRPAYASLSFRAVLRAASGYGEDEPCSGHRP